MLLYDHDCVGSQAYIKLASEVIRRERELRPPDRDDRSDGLDGQGRPTRIKR